MQVFPKSDLLEICPEENEEEEEDKEDIAFESPLKALWCNFRMNQIIGSFPSSITVDYMTLRLKPVCFLWTVTVKLVLWSTILLLMHFWLADQSFTFTDLWHRAFSFDRFSATDYFAIVAHYVFLQVAAYFLFFNNLKLSADLTKLNLIIRDLAAASKTELANPSPINMMIYRYSVCALCTLASLLYIIGVHSIVQNPEVNAFDYIIIVLIVVALYFENQNHMFSELLFLRYLGVLELHCNRLMKHLTGTHKNGYDDRKCCYERAEYLQKMYLAINNAFGEDLLVTITILVVSIVFAIYLLATFTIFIPGEKMWPFITAYILYSIIPAVRLYVLVEGSESIKVHLGEIKQELFNLEAELACFGNKNDLAKLRRIKQMLLDNIGFSANGYFTLNRGIIVGLVNSLFTYLIVLLDFKKDN